MVVYPSSWIPALWNQNTTHYSIFTTENTSELFYIKELQKCMFPITFNLMYLYQQKRPGFMAKLKYAKYQTGSNLWS